MTTCTVSYFTIPLVTKTTTAPISTKRMSFLHIKKPFDQFDALNVALLNYVFSFHFCYYHKHVQCNCFTSELKLIKINPVYFFNLTLNCFHLNTKQMWLMYRPEELKQMLTPFSSISIWFKDLDCSWYLKWIEEVLFIYLFIVSLIGS